MESILLNYQALLELWDECLESSAWLDPDVKARIIGVKTVMTEFRFLIGLKMTGTVFKITDNLSRTLQKITISAAEGQHLASLTADTLKGMRTVQSWDAFYALYSPSKRSLVSVKLFFLENEKLPNDTARPAKDQMDIIARHQRICIV